MQVKNIAAVLAFATLSAGAMADTITSEGFVHSAPAYTTASTVSRADVATSAAAAVRANVADPIAAEGLRHDTQLAGGQRDRASVRAEAVEASREAYASSAQTNEGLI